MTIKFDHINLTVMNLKESTDWYQKIFGFEQVESGVTHEGTKWGIVAYNDSMICMSEYSGRTRADRAEDGSIHRIYHFGIRVSDIDRWRGIVKENKLKLYYGGEVRYPFSRSWYIHDPSGHGIEISYTEDERLRFK